MTDKIRDEGYYLYLDYLGMAEKEREELDNRMARLAYEESKDDPRFAGIDLKKVFGIED